MIRVFQKLIYTPERLNHELKRLQSCDVDNLPLLVIEDDRAYINKPKGASSRNIDAVLSTYGTAGNRYAATLSNNRCDIVDVEFKVTVSPGTISDMPAVKGIMFWHDNGKQYIYWGWMHSSYKKQRTFSRDLFDALARQGLDSRTVDNFRVDYRAGRIHQHTIHID